MTCCFEDFKTLISTTGGQNRIKAEYTATFNRPPVGHCENSLRDMYEFLRRKNQKPKNEMESKLKVKLGSEIQYIGGSRVDITKWSQDEIADYLEKFPRAVGHFEPADEPAEEPTEEPAEAVDESIANDIRETVKKSKK